jgi:hypothetical protein
MPEFKPWQQRGISRQPDEPSVFQFTLMSRTG